MPFTKSSLKQIVAFDLDGTLSESKQPLGSEIAGLLEQLATRTKVAVISGGSFNQFKKQFLPFWKGPVNDLIVMPVDGSQCYEYDEVKGEWRLVDIEPFPQHIKEQTLAAIHKIMRNPRYGIPPAEKAYGNFIDDRGTQITFSALGQNAPIDAKKVWDPDQKKRLAIREELIPLLPEVEIVLGGATSIDFLSKGFDKATGLTRLLQRHGLAVTDMLFIGDAVFPGGNDYSPSQVGIESIKISGPQETAEVIRKILSEKSVAYFCAEYGIQGLPLYAGGLGMLAEDFVRAAGDIGLPTYAIGLFYSQRTDLSSEELRSENRISLVNHKFRLLKTQDGEPLFINVDLGQGVITLQVWMREHGSSRLYLLDADTDKNTLEQQKLLAFLYGSNMNINIMQQLLLGIGGVKLLRTLSVKPDVYHLNEGHTSFAALALFTEYLHDNEGKTLVDAIQAMKPKIVASKHTILSVAGINFSRGELFDIIQHYFTRHRIDFDEFFRLGARDEDKEIFSTTKFLINSAVRANGVSLLHTQFEKQTHPTSALIPITNGVYIPRWRSDVWPMVSADKIKPEDMWRLRKSLKKNLAIYVDSRTGIKLDPNALTIVWARRFASYKRPGVLFGDLKRLEKIVSNAAMPVQFIISGKAHPNDKEGTEIANLIKEYSEQDRFKGKLVYLSEYSINIAKELVLGADVWLNTPIPGFEACGTSGMKAALNGVLQCSTVDGWVGEVNWGNVGWMLNNDNMPEDIYANIENSIMPLFYQRDPAGVPQEWIKRVQATTKIAEEGFGAERMVRDYAAKLYLI